MKVAYNDLLALFSFARPFEKSTTDCRLYTNATKLNIFVYDIGAFVSANIDINDSEDKEFDFVIPFAPVVAFLQSLSRDEVSVTIKKVNNQIAFFTSSKRKISVPIVTNIDIGPQEFSESSVVAEFTAKQFIDVLQTVLPFAYGSGVSSALDYLNFFCTNNLLRVYGTNGRVVAYATAENENDYSYSFLLHSAFVNKLIGFLYKTNKVKIAVDNGYVFFIGESFCAVCVDGKRTVSYPDAAIQKILTLEKEYYLEVIKERLINILLVASINERLLIEAGSESLELKSKSEIMATDDELFVIDSNLDKDTKLKVSLHSKSLLNVVKLLPDEYVTMEIDKPNRDGYTVGHIVISGKGKVFFLSTYYGV